MVHGGIETHADAMQCVAETGAMAAMSSEGILANPALASAIPVHICDVGFCVGEQFPHFPKMHLRSLPPSICICAAKMPHL
jgi:hypothetical protein